MDQLLKRRDFIRGAALGALAFTVGGAQVLLTPREARAQGVPFRFLKADEAETLEALGARAGRPFPFPKGGGAGAARGAGRDARARRARRRRRALHRSAALGPGG